MNKVDCEEEHLNGHDSPLSADRHQASVFSADSVSRSGSLSSGDDVSLSSSSTSTSACDVEEVVGESEP